MKAKAELLLPGASLSARSWGAGESTMEASLRYAALLAIVLLAGCNQPAAVRRIQGEVRGLVGAGLVLQNNGAGDLAVNADGPFAFEMVQGARYSVTVRKEPSVPAQTCDVTHGEGVVGGGGVTDVEVTCRLFSPRFAYATNPGDSTISVFAVNATSGELRAAGEVEARGGPSSMAVHPSGRFAYVANHDDNTVSAYAIDAATGALTTMDGSPFQAGTGPIFVGVDPTGRFVYVANGESADVSAYTVDPATGALAGVTGSPFAAEAQPRSVTVDPSGRFAYVANFGDDSISAYVIGDGGELTRKARISAGDGPSGVAIHPSGRFAYASNSNGGDVWAYTVNPESGVLTPTGVTSRAGALARFIAVDPWGRFTYVANGGSNTVSAFRIDGATGALTPAGSFQAGSAPSALAVDPSGAFAYVVNAGSETDATSDTVSLYLVDQDTGALTPLDPVTVGDKPSSIAILQGVIPLGWGQPPPIRRVGGKVSGLVGTGLVLQNNGRSDLTVSADGEFAFSLAEGARYSITVSSQPTVPAQSCAVTGGRGVVGSGDVTDVDVSCRLFSPRFAYATVCGSNKISIFEVNATTGALALADEVHLTTPGESCPHSIAIEPAGRFAYVANRNSDTDTVSAFEIDASTGKLEAVPGSPFEERGTPPAGQATKSPFYVAVDPRGRFLYVANVWGQNVSAFEIDPDTGALAEVDGSPFGAAGEPHSVAFDSSGRYAYVGNAGSDILSTYRIEDSGALTRGADIPAGDGPNVVVIHPSGRFAYVADWNDGNLWSYAITEPGVSDPPSWPVFDHTGTVHSGARARFTAVDPWGRFAYVTNHDDGTVSAYRIDRDTGELIPVSGPFPVGSAPSGLTVDPSGRFLYVANEGADAADDTLSIYRIDTATGALTGHTQVTVGDMPTSIAILRGLDPLP